MTRATKRTQTARLEVTLAALADAVTETPEATSLLARFARFVDDAQKG